MLVSVSITWVQYPQKPEEGVISLELELQPGMSLLRSVLGTKLRPFAREHILLTAEPSLAPQAIKGKNN